MDKRTRKNSFDDVRKYMARVATALGPATAQKILKDHGAGAGDPNNLRESLCPAVVLALKGALDEFEREKSLREINPWQLSPDHPQFVKATDALDAAWQHARARATRYDALEHMCKEFDKYNVGAPGSGTRGELYEKLNKRFSRVN